ncbi:MAG: FlgD immunoglobulin-like domain containing protein, partial [Alkalispirochaeta sp.]
MHTRLSAAVAVLVFVLVFLPVQAFGQNYDPVPGGELLDRLRSSLFLGTTENTATTESVGGDVVNPAASALKQRIHIDTSYIGIVGGGALNGHAANLGLSVPTRVGVFSGSGNFVTADYDALNLGTRGSVNVSFAKDLYPSLLVGTGLRTHFGTSSGSGGESSTFGFGAGLDVGMVHIIGPVGFMPDLRWGVALSQLGVGYKPESGTTGSPAPFTPAADIQAVLVDTDAVHLVVHTGFSAPSFQNLRYRAGSQLSFFDRFALNLGWDIDLREETETGREAGSLLPSVGLTVRVATGSSGGGGGSGGADGDRRWNRSDIDIHTAWAPLYDDVWAAGAGAQIALGVVDRNPPEIAVEYPQRAHISPNNDGKSDDLLLPVAITDERYVLRWAVDIHEQKDAEGALVRRIENKEERPENEGFRNVIDRLLYVRKGVSIPEVIRWDGRTDSGGVAPDGTYVFFVTAVDDNDNVGSAGPFEVVLDNTAPDLTFIEAAGEDGLIFSPNDDGIKDVLIVETESSPEDTWTVEVLDGTDAVVYSTTVEGGAVGTISWDGLDAGGVLVPDGVYSMRVSSTDRAENTTVERLNNIIVDTEPTPIGLAIDISHFSPNGDGRRDTVTFTPDVSVTEGIREYEIVVRDRDGRARRTQRGDTLPLHWVFDGRDDGGKLLPEGTYRGELNLRYRHGNQPTAVSPEIVLDVTAPRLSVRADTPVFSPNGDGLVDTVRFMQSTDSAPTWTAVIEPVVPAGAAESRPIRRYQWSGLPAEQVEWDGRDDQGNRVPDGRYQYVLTGEDRAANRASSQPTVVELDTRDTRVYIFPSTSEASAAVPSGRDAPSAPDRRQRTGEAFSPNGDGVQDTMYLVTDITDPRGAQRFQIEILNADDKVVARVDGSDAPRRSYPWDGRDSSGSIAPDGTYRARLTVEYRHGNRPVATSPPFVLDTVPPRAAVAVAEAERVFSPDGDGDKDTIRISQSSSREPLWTGRVLRRSDNRPVRTWQFSGTLQELTWDGTNDDGEIVSDGEYYYEVAGQDDGGNRTVARTEAFRTDTRDIEIRLRASRYAFSPNNDGVHDDVTFLPEVNIDLTVTEWTLAVFPADGDPARPVFSRSGTGALEPVVWGGVSDGGRRAPDGEYRAVVTAQPVQRVEPVSVYSARTVQLDTQPPAVTVNLSTPIISPNGDGNLDELVITQETSDEERWVGTVTDDGGREVSRWEWVGPAPEELRFAGLDSGNNRLSDGFYTYRITGTDGAGNTGTSGDLRFEIYTAETPLQFYAQQRAFSPNGDGIKDSLPLTAVIALPEDVKTWTFLVVSEGLGPVYRKTGTAADIPRSFTWNGRTDRGSRAAEGPYRAELTVTYRHGNVAVAGTDSFVLDVTPPRISVTTDFTVFSPGGAGRRDSLRFDQTSDAAEGWSGRITNAAGTVVRSYSWNRTAEPFEW